MIHTPNDIKHCYKSSTQKKVNNIFFLQKLLDKLSKGIYTYSYIRIVCHDIILSLLGIQYFFPWHVSLSIYPSQVSSNNYNYYQLLCYMSNVSVHRITAIYAFLFIFLEKTFF